MVLNRLKLLFLFLLVITILGLKYSGSFVLEKKPQEKQPQGSIQVKPQEEEQLPRNVFKDNEQIKFGVYSNGIKVGSGELIYHGVKDFKGQRAQNITFSVNTLSVKDKENIYCYTDFSAPLSVERNVRIFGKEELIAEAYSADRKSVSISKSVNTAISNTTVIKSDEELGNVFLLLYALRNDEEIKEGKAYKVVLPTKKFSLIVKNKRKIKVPLGIFDAYFIESSPPKYKIWLSTGKERTPVRIQGLAALGMLYLAATEVK